MENWPHLLVDERNRGVLCSTSREDTAIALMSAFPDTTVIQIPFELASYERYTDYDFQNKLWHVSLVDRIVTPLSETLVTADFRNRRTQALRKIPMIRNLQIICQMTRLRASFGFPDIISSDLSEEISLSNPETGHFSLGVHEYAAIREIDLRTAYTELKMKVESSRILRIRNFAIYEKYLALICHSNDESTVFKGLMDEVLYNSFT